MSTITYAPDCRAVELREGESILDASLREGIPHVHACGGNAQCSTCRVIVLEGLEHCPPPNEDEQVFIEKLGFGPEIRLACQTEPRGDIAVRRAVLDEIDKALIRQRVSGADTSRVGRQKQVTLIFADIANYTRFAEMWQPYDVVHVLSRYFHMMGSIIRDHGGYILDYYGDGFLAVFEEDKSDGHALWAVRAGKRMFAALENFNEYLEQFLGQRFQIRVGIHTGEVIVGSIGVDGMRKEAVIGDAVNFASRIETANKELGTRFLISASTFAALEDRIPVGQSFWIEVKGKVGRHRVYEVSL